MVLVKFGSWSQCDMSFVHFAGLDIHIAADHWWMDTVSSRLEIFRVVAVNSMADAS